MKNQQIDRWFGISLTEKRAYYLLVFGIIGLGFSYLLFLNALEVLLDTPKLKEYYILIYYKVLLLGFSNLIISLGFISICGYTLRKIRLFRKSLKIQ